MENLGRLIEIISAIGAAATIGAGVAYATFKVLGKNWLETKFKKQLSKFNHEQTKEIARLKIEIDSLLDAKISFQQKEFEGLTELWLSISNFKSAISKLIFTKLNFDNLQNMTDDDLHEFCKTTFNFSEYQINSLKQSKDRNRKIVVTHDKNMIDVALKAQRECETIITKNGIFISEEISSLSRKIAIEFGNILTRYIKCRLTDDKDSIKAELDKETRNVISGSMKSLKSKIQTQLTN